jgi:hypothetical protein
MSSRTSRADFHQGQCSCASSFVKAGYMTATVFAFRAFPLAHGRGPYMTITQNSIDLLLGAGKGAVLLANFLAIFVQRL